MELYYLYKIVNGENYLYGVLFREEDANKYGKDFMVVKKTVDKVPEELFRFLAP